MALEDFPGFLRFTMPAPEGRTIFLPLECFSHMWQEPGQPVMIATFSDGDFAAAEDIATLTARYEAARPEPAP